MRCPNARASRARRACCNRGEGLNDAVRKARLAFDGLPARGAFAQLEADAGAHDALVALDVALDTLTLALAGQAERSGDSPACTSARWHWANGLSRIAERATRTKCAGSRSPRAAFR